MYFLDDIVKAGLDNLHMQLEVRWGPNKITSDFLLLSQINCQAFDVNKTLVNGSYTRLVTGSDWYTKLRVICIAVKLNVRIADDVTKGKHVQGVKNGA